jgi:class 3 adenylate cyclase
MVEPPTGVVTFLFTDIEGSTRLWEERPDDMRDALARHDAILRTAIEDHRGFVVKTTGDGALAVFELAPDAVAAAADALRGLASETLGPIETLRVRVAIHTGTADRRDGDYYGPTLNQASRMMSVAHGGQVLLSQTSVDAVRHTLPDGLGLLDLGDHRLRDVAVPQRVHQLTIPGLRSDFPPLHSLDAFPAAVAAPAPFAHDDEVFANRHRELDRLDKAWTRARGGVRQLVLVAGEPGIGKTRLAAELSRRAPDHDGVVLYGRSDEDAIVPYQPFVEALRHSVAAYSPAMLHQRLHGLEQDLARVFPELLGRLADAPHAAPSDAVSERYRLFEAITGLLTGITATHPVMFILDDLQWADKPTVLLLRHLVRSAHDAPLLIIVCYREMELGSDHPLTDLIADLRRESYVTSAGLDGLSEAESRVMLEGLARDDVGSSLSAALYRETGGNPLFLEELLRHLMETDRVPLGEGTQSIDLDTLDLPAGVRDVVARRLRRLPISVNDLLSLAAVIGFEFDVALLARAAQLPTEEVLDSLDQATDRGLVRADPARLGRYTFAQTLIRQTLYQESRTATRAQLHARVGAALEQERHRPSSTAALAQHFTQALPLEGADKAIKYTSAAGDEALADLALEDAVSYFERALHLHAQYTPTDWSQQVDLLTDLAEALMLVDEAAGVDAALRAVNAARVNGSSEQFGRAVIVFTEPLSAVLSYPDQVRSLLTEAQRRLGEHHGALRARLMTIEAFKYSAYQLQGRDGRALASRAVALARDAGAVPTLTAALFARAMSLESTPQTAERLALGNELVTLGQAEGRHAAMTTVHGLRVLAGVHLELGDADALNSTVKDLTHVGQDLRWLPGLVFAAQWRATQALLEGRFDAVRDAWNDMRQYTRAYRAVAPMEAQQAYYLARERGDLAEMIGPLEQIATTGSESLYVPAMLAVAQLDTGAEAAAVATLASLDTADLGQGETESAWAAVLALLAEVAATGDSAAHAVLLYDLLEPFAGRLIATVIGLACLGAAERYQGMLATTLERWDDAEGHFERALDLERRMRGNALAPRTRFWHARFLLRRARSGDDRTAREILGEVAEDTRRIGMRRLSEQAEELLAR